MYIPTSQAKAVRKIPKVHLIRVIMMNSFNRMKRSESAYMTELQENDTRKNLQL